MSEDDDFEDDNEDEEQGAVDKKVKKVKSILVDPDSDAGKPIYKLLQGVIKKHRKDLADADVNIAIAFRSGWSADAFDRIPLGKFKIHSELDVQLSQYSGVLELNREVWDTLILTPGQREAWIHFFLCYAQVATDGEGEAKVNDHGFVILKKRAPDTVVFNENITLFGHWHPGLIKTHKAFEEAKQSPLLAEMEANAKKKTSPAGKPKLHQA